jgi:hypothetical protein
MIFFRIGVGKRYGVLACADNPGRPFRPLMIGIQTAVGAFNARLAKVRDLDLWRRETNRAPAATQPITEALNWSCMEMCWQLNFTLFFTGAEMSWIARRWLLERPANKSDQKATNARATAQGRSAR